MNTKCAKFIWKFGAKMISEDDIKMQQRKEKLPMTVGQSLAEMDFCSMAMTPGSMLTISAYPAVR